MLRATRYRVVVLTSSKQIAEIARRQIRNAIKGKSRCGYVDVQFA